MTEKEQVKSELVVIIEKHLTGNIKWNTADLCADEICAFLFDKDKFVRPTEKECVDYIVEKNLMKGTISSIVDTVNEFIDYYESVNWVVGKSKKPMKSWKKALNNWCKRGWNKKKDESKVSQTILALHSLNSIKGV
jgi:hypothetical protein